MRRFHWRARDYKPWAALGAGLIVLIGALSFVSAHFGYAHQVSDMPVFTVVAILIAAGVLYLALPLTIAQTLKAGRGNDHTLLILILAVGLVMRLLLLGSEPVLEDDYQRYLWDGAQTAHGLNPYASSPNAAKSVDPQTTEIGRLALQSGEILGRVNHPHLKSLYPPIAQAFFALSHWASPWSLTAWRLLCLVCDAATVWLILMLLRATGRPALWVALYWWNPLIAKEIINSAHMDVLLGPLILGALVLALRKYPLIATMALVAAAGAKIWPALLLPLIWRPLIGKPAQLAYAVVGSLAAAGLMAWPMTAGGLDATSGLVAYAKDWTTNSALFPQIEALLGTLTPYLGRASSDSALAARALLGLVLAALALALARRPIGGASDLVTRSAILVVAVFLLMPAQFPWYYIWVVPFLPFIPLYGLLVLTITLPLYYASFHFIARDAYEVFSDGLVWLIWLPAWALLAIELAPSRLRTWPGAKRAATRE